MENRMGDDIPGAKIFRFWPITHSGTCSSDLNTAFGTGVFTSMAGMVKAGNRLSIKPEKAFKL